MARRELFDSPRRRLRWDVFSYHRCGDDLPSGRAASEFRGYQLYEIPAGCRRWYLGIDDSVIKAYKFSISSQGGPSGRKPSSAWCRSSSQAHQTCCNADVIESELWNRGFVEKGPEPRFATQFMRYRVAGGSQG